MRDGAGRRAIPDRAAHRSAVAGRRLVAAGCRVASARASAEARTQAVSSGRRRVCVALGRRVALGGFDPTHFKDFVWRGMFAKSLPDDDFELVTSRAFGSCAGRGRRCMRSALLRRSSGARSTPGSTPRASTSCWSRRRFRGSRQPPTRMVVRYHDAIPLLMPHTIKDRGYHRAAHYQRTAAQCPRRCLVRLRFGGDTPGPAVGDAASRGARGDDSEHGLAPFLRRTTPAARVPESRLEPQEPPCAPRRAARQSPRRDLVDGSLSYLLMVCTIEPRKNHLTAARCLGAAASQGFDRLNLVFVGSFGWDHQAILRPLRAVAAARRPAPARERAVQRPAAALSPCSRHHLSELRRRLRLPGRRGHAMRRRRRGFRHPGASRRLRRRLRVLQRLFARPIWHGRWSVDWPIGSRRARMRWWKRAVGSRPSTFPSGSCRSGASSCATSSRHERWQESLKRRARAVLAGPRSRRRSRTVNGSGPKISRASLGPLLHRRNRRRARLGASSRRPHATARMVPP